MSKTLKRDYAWNTLGVFLQNLISPLLLIAITRLNGIDDSGLFSFAFSIAIIFWTFGMWGGRTYQVSDIKSIFSNKAYIAVRIILVCIMIPSVVIFSLLNQYDFTKTSMLLLLVAMKAFESVADSFYGVMQAHDKLYKTGISLAIKAVLGFVSFLVVDFYTDSILLGSLCLVVVNFGVLILYDIPVARALEDLSFRPSQLADLFHETKKIFKACLPISIVMFLTMFSLNIPRYFIDTYHTQDIGYFGIIAMPVTLVGLLITFMIQPNIMKLAYSYSNEKSAYTALMRKIILYIFFAGTVVILVTAIAGVTLLDFMFARSFESYWLALLVIVIGGVVNAMVMVLINVMTIMRSLKPQAYILFTTNIFLFIMSFLLIPNGGIDVAASLFLTTNILQLLVLIWVYVRIISRAPASVDFNEKY